MLITNASMFHRPAVERGLAILDANQGEIWAKLEAGTDAYYQLVERTKIPFRRILDNIRLPPEVRPARHPEPVHADSGRGAPAERDRRLLRPAERDRRRRRASSSGVQVYTVARQPAESFVEPLTNAELDAIAQTVRDRTSLPAPAFYGVPDRHFRICRRRAAVSRPGSAAGNPLFGRTGPTLDCGKASKGMIELALGAGRAHGARAAPTALA